MAHNATARRAAAAVPLVLYGERGRVVEGYMPADEDLAAARAASADGCRQHVVGPHLRQVRTNYAANKTGIVGISIARNKTTGRHHLYVNLGNTHRRFCVETLGSTEAWRRAIQLRRAHLEKLALANAAILAARARNAAKTSPSAP